MAALSTSSLAHACVSPYKTFGREYSSSPLGLPRQASTPLQAFPHNVQQRVTEIATPE